MKSVSLKVFTFYKWMPQMAPMWWAVLFIWFNLTLGLTIMKLHFNA